MTLLTAAHDLVPAERKLFVRDMYFVRARVAENLATWEAQYLDDAARWLRLGLDIREEDHGRDVRGRALGDLGNVLGKIAARDGTVGWEQVDAAFEEALTLLPHETDMSRAIVLSNFAVSLMDRPTGDRGSNGERSLSLADEALLVAQQNDRTLPWVREAHAGMHMTRGNALRTRLYGARRERLEAAREAFNRGYRIAPDGSHISGLLRLNQALVAAELASLRPGESFGEEALRCFEEAREVVASDPVLGPVTTFAEATHREDEPSALELARTAVAQLEKMGAAREVGWRALWLAQKVARLGDGHRNEAGELLQLALKHYRALADEEGIVETLRAIGSLEMGVTTRPTAEQLARCEQLLDEAQEHAEKLWRAQPTIEWRLSQAYVTVVSGELAWVKSARGAPVEELIRVACLAKDREFLEHTKLLAAQTVVDAADEASTRARRLEMSRWQAQNDAAPTESVLQTHNEVRDAIAEARVTEALLVGRYDEVDGEAVRARIAGFFAVQPNAVVLDLTVSRWGTVVIALSARTQRVIRVPLTTVELDAFLSQANGWATVYERWRDAGELEKPEAWRAWQAATHDLLAMLQRTLLQPVLDELGPLGDCELVIVPGTLAGLPLHAVPIAGGGRLVDAAKSVAYAVSAARLPTEAPVWHSPPEVLCMLCDPPREGRKPLLESPLEIGRVAQRLAQSGSAVRVVASVGGATGRNAHAALQSDLFAVSDKAPSPETFVEMVPEVSALIYSGHGFSSGLLLANADGSPERLMREHVLGMSRLRKRPFVHLSACSTAQGGTSRTDMFNLASCLLRVGARVVLAGLWEVRDEQSARLSDAFYTSLAEGVPIAGVATAAAAAVRAAVGDDEVLTWAPFVVLLGP